MKTLVEGQHTCYVCQSEIQWQANLNGRIATYEPYTVANVTAIDNRINVEKVVDHVVLDVAVRCKACGVQNKFTQEHQVWDTES